MRRASGLPRSTSRPRQARCPSQRPASTSAPASLAPARVKPRAAGPPADRAGASESPSPIAGGRTLVLGRRAKDKSRAADTLVQPGSTLRQQFSKHPRPAPRAPARSASRSARANSGRGRLYERGNTPRMGPPYRSSTAGASVLSTRARRQKLGGICCRGGASSAAGSGGGSCRLCRARGAAPRYCATGARCPCAEGAACARRKAELLCLARYRRQRAVELPLSDESRLPSCSRPAEQADRRIRSHDSAMIEV